MPCAGGIGVLGLELGVVITETLAQLTITLCEGDRRDTGYAVAMPKLRDKVYPLLVAVVAGRAAEYLVSPRERLVQQGYEIVLQ